MSQSVKDGGPAFPSEFYETEHGDRVEAFAGTRGMTLRDWFAGQALASIGLAMMESGREDGHPVLVIYAGVARASYAIADAMIAARDAQP